MSGPAVPEDPIARYAAAIEAELGLAAKCAEWAPWADEQAVGRTAHETGRDQPWPVLNFDDVSAIPFLQDISGVEFYQLRARLRAGDGDVFAATCPAVPGYEAYNQTFLGLGSPTFVHADYVDTACEIGLACQHGQAFQQLVAMTRDAGGLTIHPYMGSEPSWRLASVLQEATGCRVRCVGPPPPVTAYANHKGHVTRAARALLSDGVLGGNPVVDTVCANSAEALAEGLAALAERHPRVALKMTRCASAMGNGLYDSEELRGQSLASLTERVREFLTLKEWTPGDEVLAMAWEDAWSSPSTQLWIPAPSNGPPVVEGVYEQLLVGEEQVFLGALPSRLGDAWDERLTSASIRLGALYQALGYRGRCSFDFILVGERGHVVECNGRWGGTSTPMHLVERVRPGERPPYRARDVVSPALVGMPFEALLERLSGHLFDVRTGQGSYVVYNVGCLAEHGKVDVVAFGDDHADVTAALEERLPELLGL